MSKPIFGTDLSKPTPELIQGWRDRIQQLRGEISDVSHEFPGLGEHLKCVEGLMTCGLVTLHHVRETVLEGISRDAAQTHLDKINNKPR